MSGLRRTQMSVGLAVGLREDHGTEVRGVIERRDQAARDGSQIEIGPGGRRSLIVTTPAPMSDVERRHAPAALAERRAPAPVSDPGREHSGEQRGGAR
jgi:hypothetical protein